MKLMIVLSKFHFFYGFKEYGCSKRIKNKSKIIWNFFDNLSTSYFFSRQTIIPKFGYGMAPGEKKFIPFYTEMPPGNNIL